MSPEGILQQLVRIQSEVDLANVEALKEEHQLKMKHFNSLKTVLEERDALIREIDNFWEIVILSSDLLEIIKECEENIKIDISWVKELKVEYKKGNKFYSNIKVKENKYFENSFLEKEFSLFGNECTNTEIRWKGQKKYLENPLIKFFISEGGEEEGNMSIFQILSDIYLNAVYYYVRLEEGSEEEE